MGIIDRIGQGIGGFVGSLRDGYNKALSFAVSAPWLRATGSVNQMYAPNLGRIKNQQDLYARLSWLSIAIEHVAKQAAGVAFGVFQRVGEKGEEQEAMDNHEIEVLLRNPNP